MAHRPEGVANLPSGHHGVASSEKSISPIGIGTIPIVDHAPANESLSADEFSAAVTTVTTAFGDPTRRRIYLFARQSESGVTTGETASRFNLHPNVARHHLDKLAAGGYLQVQVDRRESTGAGRPSKRYQATGKDMALQLPAWRDDLLLSLLGRVLTLLPPDKAEAVAEEVGVDYGRELAAHMAPGESHRSMRAALHDVAEALTAHGFAARSEARGGSLMIVSQHCPFGDAALQNPVICAVDRGMVKGMLDALAGATVPCTEASLPRGDEVCVTSV